MPRKTRKYSYEFVRRFIEIDSKSGCKLLSDHYEGNKKHLKIRCRCGNTYECSFDHFKNCSKKQCPECSGKKRYTIDNVRKCVSELSDCKLLSDSYVNRHSKLLFRCSCGNTFNTSFQRFIELHKRCCDECTRKKLSARFCKTTEQFSKEVERISNGEIKVIGEYRNSSAKVLVTHMICGHQWMANPNDLLYKQSGCPNCNESKGEKAIAQWLSEHGISFEREYKFDDCCNKRKLPFDFAILDGYKIKCLIEYDGIQHYDNRCFGGGRSYQSIKQNDLFKTAYCKRKGLKLIRIPYTQLTNINSILNGAFK